MGRVSKTYKEKKIEVQKPKRISTYSAGYDTIITVCQQLGKLFGRKSSKVQVKSAGTLPVYFTSSWNPITTQVDLDFKPNSHLVQKQCDQQWKSGRAEEPQNKWH